MAEPDQQQRSMSNLVLVLAVFAATGGVQIIALVGLVLTSRLLGVEGRGSVVLAVTLSSVTSVLTLGGSLPRAITIELARTGVAARDAFAGLLRRWTVLSIAFGLIPGAIYWVWQGGLHSGETTLEASGVVLMACTQTLMSVMMACFLGERTRPAMVLVASIMPQVIVVSLLAVALGTGTPVSPAAIIYLLGLGSLLSAVLRFPALKKPTHDPALRVSSTEFGRQARRGHIGNMAPIDGLGIDRLLIGALLGNTSLGLYTTATTLATPTTILGRSLASAALPAMAEASVKSEEEARRSIRLWVASAAALVVTIVAGLMIGNARITPLAFGDEFRPAVSVAYWILPALGLLAIRRIQIAGLQAVGKEQTASRIELAVLPLVAVAAIAGGVTNDLDVTAAGMLVAAATAVVALSLALRGPIEPRPVTTDVFVPPLPD